MFRRTFQTIDSEADGRSPWVLVVAGVLLAGWLYWFVGVPVTLMETSAAARVEVANASFNVDAPVSGKVAVMNLVLGRTVAEGDVLLELDGEALRLQLEEATAKEASFGPQLEAVGRELEAELDALRAEGGRDISTLEEARNRYREARVSAQLAAGEERRLRKLFDAKTISEAEFERGKAEAARRQAAALAVAAEGRKLAAQASSGKNERKVKIASLERTEAELRGELAVQRAKIAELRHALALRQVRAPAAGTISAIGQVRVGTVLKEGERIVTILAGDGLRLVAEYSPAAVFGRVHAGQSARVRFEGFPWVEYGIPSATVTRVAGEVHEGHARVELALDERTAQRIPLQHGQPAEVTIEVDRKTPFRLVLRVIGKIAEGTPAALPRT